MKTDTQTDHSRFDEAHYRTCQSCYEDHLDFMQEQAQEARMDEMEYQNNDEF